MSPGSDSSRGPGARPAPGKRNAARQRIDQKRAAERAAADAAARKRRTIIGAITATVAVVMVLIVVIVVQTARTSGREDAAAPSNVTDGAVTVNDGGSVLVQVYEDFLCPACQQFEATVGDTLAQLADDGDIELRYHPIAILDRASTDDYSTRSLNAAAVVADVAGPEAFLAMHDALFAEQPAEGGAGLSDDRLVELAAAAGATGTAVEEAIRDLQFEGWTERVTEQSSQVGVTSTPTVLVDGQPLADRTPAGLAAAVAGAQGES